MSCNLQNILREHRDDLIARVMERLRQPGHPHYEQLGLERMQRRVASLVDAFIASLAENGELFVRHVEGIAEQRAEEGFFLAEMQSTLSVLEERAWELVVAEVALEDQVGCLSRVTATVGRAKDGLARIFLAHKQRAESELARLEARFGALLAGTISTEVREDD